MCFNHGLTQYRLCHENVRENLESETIQTIFFNFIFYQCETIVLEHLGGKAWEKAMSPHKIYYFVFHLIHIMSAAHVAVGILSACKQNIWQMTTPYLVPLWMA